MWTSLSGQVLRLSPGRVDALASLAEERGARSYLGVPLDTCRPCSRAAVFARIARLAPRARRVRQLPARSGEAPSTLFVARDGRHTYRIVAEAIGDRQYAIESVDIEGARAPLAADLDRVEDIEERW